MIHIYTFAYNNPEFLEKQYLCFKKFLKREHQLVCINNANDTFMWAKILEVATKYGIQHYTPENINHSKAGTSHQQALNWAWHNVMRHSDTLIIVDHDMFPVDRVRLYENYDIAAIMQGRGEHIKYFHPGFIIIHPSLKDRESVDFTGEEIEGHRCDSGGNWHHYMQAHPDLEIKELSLVDIASEDFKEDELQMCQEFMLHFRNGSNWKCISPEQFARKRENLIKLLGL